MPAMRLLLFWPPTAAGPPSFRRNREGPYHQLGGRLPAKKRARAPPYLVIVAGCILRRRRLGDGAERVVALGARVGFHERPRAIGVWQLWEELDELALFFQVPPRLSLDNLAGIDG